MATQRSSLRPIAPAVAAVLFCWGLAAAPAAHASTSKEYDLNSDGYPDTVVSVPGGTVDGAAKAGYVVVMWGGAHGLSPSRRTVVSRATKGVPGSATAGEGFGWRVSSTDLDGDQHTDLIINAAHGNAGSVIMFGGPKGLTDPVAVPGYSTFSAIGDFNSDARMDVVFVQSGDSTGSTPAGSKAVVWNNPVSRKGKPASTRAFGAATTDHDDVKNVDTGDVNGDGIDDLALAEYTGQGRYAVEMYLGGDQADFTTALPVMSVAGPLTGLGLGDVDGDGHDDLVVGDASAGAGSVTVAYGATGGLVPADQWTRITQDTPGVPGADEAGDQFGAAISVLDTNGDWASDVAVGVPGESVGDVEQAGAVIILLGAKGRPLSGAGARTFTQNTPGIPGAVEAGDRFGAAVQLKPGRVPEHPDLLTSAPHENDGDGGVWYQLGGGTGVTTTGAVSFGPHGVGVPAKNAAFGSHLN